LIVRSPLIIKRFGTAGEITPRRFIFYE